MAKVGYRIEPREDRWSILRNGQAAMSYLTREAAFEVAVSKASGDVRSGHDVVIEVHSPENDDPGSATSQRR
jgi:predicted nucleotidyltransferase